MDQPEPGKSVTGVDSAGHPASGWGGDPQPARDGSAANHLEGLELFMQAGPPPSSREDMVPQEGRCGNRPGDLVGASEPARAPVGAEGGLLPGRLR